MTAKTKIAELTVGELRAVVAETVREAISDSLEDLVALNSVNYIHSIREARANYQKSDFTSLDEILSDCDSR